MKSQGILLYEVCGNPELVILCSSSMVDEGQLSMCSGHAKRMVVYRLSFESRREKTGLRGFQPGPTQTGLFSHRSRLEA